MHVPLGAVPANGRGIKGYSHLSHIWEPYITSKKSHIFWSCHDLVDVIPSVFCNSLDGRWPANLHMVLSVWCSKRTLALHTLE
jgi:hypothetical protein